MTRPPAYHRTAAGGDVFLTVRIAVPVPRCRQVAAPVTATRYVHGRALRQMVPQVALADWARVGRGAMRRLPQSPTLRPARPPTGRGAADRPHAAPDLANATGRDI
jgi:hypothetical protein